MSKQLIYKALQIKFFVLNFFGLNLAIEPIGRLGKL